jgi:hypothetical protein
VGDALTDVLRGLRHLDVAVNVEELCEVLWLCQQGARWDDLPAAVPIVGPHPARSARSTRPDTPDQPHRRRQQPGGRPRQQRPETSTARMYTLEPLAGTEGTLIPYVKVSLPDAPALPNARELARILRPLRYDPRRTHPGDGIDEEATALRIAQAGVRLPVGRTTRRRRLDADLVFDIGGSGPLWTRLAAELRTMLEVQGAFRSVRFWVLDSDSADLLLLPGSGGSPAGAGTAGAVGYRWDVICEPPRKPLVIVLTDGTGRSWQTKDVYQPLRGWAVHGTVLAIHLLPDDMWNRTALRALPVAFHPAQHGYHSGARVDVSDVELSVAGLDRRDLAAATAIPVIGLDASWLRSWLPLLRGPEAGAVPGYALLIPAPDRDQWPAPGNGVGRAAEAGPTEEAEDVVLTAEKRVQRFTLTASQDARRLARLLSVTTPTLPAMRKIRHKLLPNSRPGILAEVMLGGLMEWTLSTPATALSGAITFDFHLGVRDLLRERPGGLAELAWDTALVSRALWSDLGGGLTYDGWVVPSDLGTAPDGAVLTEPALLPLYPVPAPRAASGRSEPDAWRSAGKADDAPVGPPPTPVRIGIWGSTKSGRTTFLTVLGMFFSEWTYWRRGEQWRVRSMSGSTEAFISDCIAALKAPEGRFPPPTLPRQSGSEPLSFRLERRRRHTLAPMRWLRPERLAEITVTLQDRAGVDFIPDSQSAGAASYMTESDVLVYFFDPTHDDKMVPPKWHSADFFTSVETGLGMSAATGDHLYQSFLPQHIAVCVPKLDDQRVFDAARRYGCVEIDPRTRMPWVPPRHAKRLFEAITYGQGSIQADNLRRALSRSFHPKRMSFHALSSVGFWVPEGGQFDLSDVCNVIEMPGSRPTDEPGQRLRGPVRPVHLLDPLVSLVERAMKQAGRP